MKRILLAAAFLLVSFSAQAQLADQGRVVSACGTPGITYTAGAFGPFTVDTNGNLCFNGSAGGLSNVNVTQWDSVALGAPSAYGTSPGAVNVPGVNAFITNTPSTLPSNTGTTGTTPTSGTVSVTNTFQSVLASSATRKGCQFQNQGTHLMYFFVGANGSASTATSFQVQPGQTFNCASPGIVVGDNISLTGTAGDAFMGVSQ